MLIAGGERLSAAGGLLDGRLAGRLVDVVEDGPVAGLDLGLRGHGDLGEHVADAMHQAPLAQRRRERLLDRGQQPGGTVGDHQNWRAQATAGQVGEEVDPGVVAFAGRRGQPRNTGAPVVVIP